MIWYHKLWRVDGDPSLSVTTNTVDDLVIVGSGTDSARLEYPNQFECTEQEPCNRELRNAMNMYAMLYTGGAGFDYYLVTLDTQGTEK